MVVWGLRKGAKCPRSAVVEPASPIRLPACRRGRRRWRRNPASITGGEERREAAVPACAQVAAPHRITGGGNGTHLPVEGARGRRDLPGSGQESATVVAANPIMGIPAGRWAGGETRAVCALVSVFARSLQAQPARPAVRFARSACPRQRGNAAR